MTSVPSPSPRKGRLTRKSTVVGLAVVGAAVVLVSAGRTWVTGTVDDAVLGASRIGGIGTEVAPGIVALALAAAAATLASATSGRVVRVVTVVVELVCALALGGLAARVLLDPSGVLGRVAATSTGRTGTIETHASAGPWPWIALSGAVLLVAAGLAGAVGSRRWRGLSARYDAPTGPGGLPGRQGTGSRGERVASDWDRLSGGDDPTVD